MALKLALLVLAPSGTMRIFSPLMSQSGDNMPVSVELSYDTKKLLQKLQAMGKGFDDFQTPLTRSGTYMEGAIGKRFRGANWKPLSPRTIEIHPHRAGGKPLNDGGQLKASVTSNATQNLSKNKLQYGTAIKSAPLHNFGGRTAWGTYVPKREFLYFDKADEKAISEIFEDYIKELSDK